MKKIAIYGAGGLGREVACLINAINIKQPVWELIGFFDDGKEKGLRNEYGKILGGINEVNSYPEELAVVVAIALPKTVENIVNNIISPKITFPNIISPDITFLDKNNFIIGRGNIISFRCVISCNVMVGDFNIFNWGTTVGHDVKVNNYNSFMPYVKISGEIKIGNKNYFGVNSVVLQQICIGNENIIGASSTVVRDTKDGVTYIGNPARRIS